MGGRRFKREGTYAHLLLLHILYATLQPMQHCKAIIFQRSPKFKINLKTETSPLKALECLGILIDRTQISK